LASRAIAASDRRPRGERAKAGSAEARFGARTRKTKPTQTSRILGTTAQKIWLTNNSGCRSPTPLVIRSQKRAGTICHGKFHGNRTTFIVASHTSSFALRIIWPNFLRAICHMMPRFTSDRSTRSSGARCDRLFCHLFTRIAEMNECERVVLIPEFVPKQSRLVSIGRECVIERAAAQGLPSTEQCALGRLADRLGRPVFRFDCRLPNIVMSCQHPCLRSKILGWNPYIRY
jgi:hypothetical protein